MLNMIQDLPEEIRNMIAGGLAGMLAKVSQTNQFVCSRF